ncbi:MAG TPA: sigma factor [Gemmatimonadales bacterium]|nr:sigma factor [Gemmatimonadales bacterium]
MPGSVVAPNLVLPDALVVQRIAALGDKAALAELDARHGMTLYATAYGLMFDSEAADAAVAAVFREVWRSAASFDASAGSVARWLAHLIRQVAHDRLRGKAWVGQGSSPLGQIVAAAPRDPPTVAPALSLRRRAARALAQLTRIAAVLVVPVLLLA